MTKTEYWVERTARGEYRSGGWETHPDIPFEHGDEVVFNPFTKFTNLHPIFCTFIQYHGEDDQIAEIRIPPKQSRRVSRTNQDVSIQECWFREKPGNYLVHCRYLTPQ